GDGILLPNNVLTPVMLTTLPINQERGTSIFLPHSDFGASSIDGFGNGSRDLLKG
ncbi:hypothetical protein HAX54_031227, partial [Datura stramonium]|nr:hypothetical protein [Datura stramonium]